MRYLFSFFWGLHFFVLSAQSPLITKDSLAQQQWVDSVYSSLSTKQKIGQLFTIWVATKQGPDKMKEILEIKL